MTISQVDDPRKQPRNVVFRENARLINQPFLSGLEMDPVVTGVPSLLFTHGHQDLNFAHLCLPHSQHRRAYIYRSENLLMIPHELRSDVTPIEHTNTDALDTMTLKEEIDKW